MYRLLRLDLNNIHDRNAWYLVLEIFWSSVLASAAAFNSAYAIRLGATNTDIGLLSSLPALLAVIVSIPAGKYLERRARRKTPILVSLTAYRFGYALIALVPLVRLGHIPQGILITGALILFTIPAHLFNVGFTPMLAEIIPEERRAATFSARNIIYNASYSVIVFLFGQWLSRVNFPVNYQVMYIVGFLGSLVSIYYLIKVQVPDSVPFPLALVEKQPNLLARLRGMVADLRAQPRFARIALNTFLHGFGLWLAGPLYMLFYVNALSASDAWIGLQGTVASAATIVGFAFWRMVMMRWGEPKTLKRVIIFLGAFPVLVGLFHNLTLILFAVALNGFLSPGVTLSHYNTLLKVIPPESRPKYTALYMTIANVGIFIGPLVGVALANTFGIAPVLIGCGLLSITGSFSFWIWPVRNDEE
jgi:MFS family permease